LTACSASPAHPGQSRYRSYDTGRQIWAETTWSDVGRAAARWQAALAAEELLPGERVAVHLRNSKEWVYFDQAALACALVVVPLYTDDRPENIAYILRDSAARVLLVQDVAGWKRLAPVLKDHEELKRVLILDAPESPAEEFARMNGCVSCRTGCPRSPAPWCGAGAIPTRSPPSSAPPARPVIRRA
jgi:long-chain acyl-CoA synthetase